MFPSAPASAIFVAHNVSGLPPIYGVLRTMRTYVLAVFAKGDGTLPRVTGGKSNPTNIMGKVGESTPISGRCWAEAIYATRGA